jgi:hypothetical protein
MKNRILTLQILITFIILASPNYLINAQGDTIRYLYSIGVKQSFSSWGNCSSDPDYQYANFKLLTGTPPTQVEDTTIYSDRLNQLVLFDHDFFNDRQDKDLNYLVDGASHKYSTINVHTYASDIINDHDLYYDFPLADLVIGDTPQSHEASDPCNNFISNNREGYKMTSTLIVDDPIFLTYEGDYNYDLESEIFTLKIDDYYKNGRSERPVLQVALESDGVWMPLNNVSVNPGATIHLSYETIAGRKDDQGSHFYDWMGKRLQFRVIKTLINGKNTWGNIIPGVVFYPRGMQYTILQSRRTFCNNKVSVYVKLENTDDKGYLNSDPSNLFYWAISSGVDSYNCTMQETDDPTKFRIVTELDGMPGDPFDEPNANPITWSLQLIEKEHTDNIACVKTFTIPPKPEAITTSQMPPLYTINGVAYDVPDGTNLYVMLDIDDPYDFSYLRLPYTVMEGEKVLKTVEGIPDSYENMSSAERAALDAEFEEHFIEMVDIDKYPNNSYKSYFDVRLNEWMNDNAQGFPITNNGAKWIVFPKNGNYFLYVTDTSFYGYIYKVTINGNSINDGYQKTTNSTEKPPAISPDGNTCIYVKDYTYSNHTIWKTSLVGNGINNGTQISNSQFKNNQIFPPNGSYIIVQNPTSGLNRITLSNNTTTSIYSSYSNTPLVSPDGTFVVFTDNYSDPQKATLSSSGTIGTVSEITTDNYYLKRIAPDGSYAFATSSRGSDFYSLYKLYLSGAKKGQSEIINTQFYSFTNGFDISPDGTFYLYTYYTSNPRTGGIFKAPLNGNGINNGVLINSAYVYGGLAISPDGNYFLYPNSDDNNRIYKQYLNTEAAFYDFYPNTGIAQSWYDTYKAIYKEKWLSKRLGIKVTKDILANQDQVLHLVDNDGCEYPPFTIHVKTPANPSFSTSILSNPTDACAKNGTARITYNGGGVPPYVHSAGTLSSIGNQIVVTGLSYGENVVHFNDASGNESSSLTITIGSATRGITSTPALPQTCTPANGQITINVGSMAGTKTYKLINEDTYEEYEGSTTANSRIFSNLPAGKYTAEVESGTCFFSNTGIEVSSQIFKITSVSPTDATTIGGTGTISMAFANRTNNVSWISGVPSVFNTSENTNSISYSGVVPYTYNYTARHIDNANRTCNVSGTFTVKQPSFEARVNIYETDNDLSISASLLNGNSLITPYRFRLLNSSRTEVSVGTNNSSFSATTQTSGSYILNMVYGSNNIDIYTFNYPATTITNNYTVTPPTCPGGNGSISLNPAGGIDGSGFTVSTDGVEYTASTTFIAKDGNFGYYIKDGNISNADVNGNPVTINRSLVNYFEVPIQDPAPVYADKVESVDVTCAGLNNGSITIEELSGGSGNYHYRVDNGAWFNPQTPITGISPGSHNVYLQDNLNNCPIITLATFTISEPARIEIDSIRIVQPTCELENGEIYLEVMGGNGYYQFDWSYNGSPYYSSGSLAEDSISYLGNSLPYGFYSLNVTDNKDCNFSYTAELNEYINPEIGDVAITDVACYAESNGVVEVLSMNGTNTFNWIAIRGLDDSHNDTIYDLSNQFNNLPTGRYELSAEDNIGCVSDLIYPLVVNQPDDILSVVVDTIYPVLINGTASGAIRCTVFGGNVGLKDINLFNASNELIENKSERSQFPVVFENLLAGNYNLYVEDIKGCSFTSPLQTVIEPQSALGFIVTEKNNALCKAQTGNFTVEAFGGWGDYSFKRANDNAYYPGNSFENLYAGSYIVSVRDKYGAVYSDTVVIHEPKDDLQAKLTDYTAPTCENNGSLLVNLDGGTAPYKLVFDENTDTIEISTPQDYLLANRPTGNYLLHMTDYNGCKFDLETSLPDSGLLDISEFNLTYSSTNSSSDGTIEAIINGGTPPLSFSWREIFGASLAETGAILSNVPSNYYELTVSETNGCSVTERVYLPAVSDLALEIIELGHETSYLANNGFAQLRSQFEQIVSIELINPSGTRMLYDVNTPTSDFYEENGNLHFSNLSGGNYHITVINNLNEKAYAEFKIIPYKQFYIKDILLTHATEIGLANGKISIVVAGGAGNNSFSWQYLDGTTGPLNIRDNEYTSTLSNAPAGNYLFTATDQYNNSISQTVTIEQPTQPLDITVTEYRNESCKNYEDAYLTVQASGGWGDYQFKQDAEEYFSNSHTWLNLDVREHYFYIIDKMGTIDSIAFSITEPDYLTAGIELIDSVNCKNASDGNILFNINGGTAPYRFAFQNQANLWIQDTVARNLAEGSYTFLFTDLNNCTGQDTLTIYMPESDSLLFNKIDVTHTTCDTDNGAITVDMKGGTMPYRYQWTDFSNNTISTENTVSGLAQNGYYFLDVLDVHNCPQHYEQLISPSTNPVVTEVSTTDALCYGGNTGTANIVEAIAGTPYAPYHFTWSNSDTGEFADGYNAGIHSVIIRDTNNCFTEKYFEISQPDSLQIVLTDSKDPHCFGYDDGYLQVEAQGGVGNYQYSWSNGGASERTDSLYKGTYTLTVTDFNQCTTVQSFEINEPPKVIVDLGEDIKICPGNEINIDGQEFATHQWSNPDGILSNERFVKLNSEGTYYLEVTNDIGCYAWDTISVSIGNDALQAEFLMTSEAYLGDSIFIYEISNLELDSLSWDYSHQSFIDVTDSELPEYMLQLESLETGIFNIALWAYSGGCMSTTVKQIEIIPNDGSKDDSTFIGYKDPLIKDLKVYPNPSNGYFTLKVELREPADIKLVFFSVDYGRVIDQRQEYGLDNYELAYQLPGLNTGVYIIMLTAENERKQTKIIIENE